MSDFQSIGVVLFIAMILMSIGLLISGLSLRRTDRKLVVASSEYAGKARTFWLSLSASQQEELGQITGRTDQKAWIQQHGSGFSGLDAERVYLELCNQGYLKWGVTQLETVRVEPSVTKAGVVKRQNTAFKRRKQQVAARNRKQSQ